MENALFFRPPAIKCAIRELLEGKYVQENEQKPNYLLNSQQEKIYKANIIAIVVGKEKQGAITNLLIDDGTGTIVFRSFEENKIIEEIHPGEVILSIGKVRVYNQEKYFSPELVKKVSPAWLKVRMCELKDKLKEKVKTPYEKSITGSIILEKDLEKETDPSLKNKEDSFKAVEEEIIEDEVVGLPFQKLLRLIKELDRGEGVAVEEILEHSPLRETEKLLERMLQQGDIFQNVPGKIKVL